MVGSAGELLNETEPLRLDAERNRLPVIYPTRSFMDVGGLMSYSTNIEEVNWRIATYIDKILKDAKPADLPVEQPTKYDLVINLKEARAIGLTIPSLLLLRADKVIEYRARPTRPTPPMLKVVVGGACAFTLLLGGCAIAKHATARPGLCAVGQVQRVVVPA